jgi:hypothetical protein
MYVTVLNPTSRSALTPADDLGTGILKISNVAHVKTYIVLDVDKDPLAQEA